MDSVTQVALIGVAGTVLGALGGVVGAVRAAAISTRGQSTLEDSKSRRAAYSACATALILRRDTISTLMEGMRSEDIDLDTAKEKLAQAQAMRADVMRTIGAVVVEGPEYPAAAAESAAHHLDVWLDGLAYWIGEGMPDRMRDQSQWHNRVEDRQLTEDAIERFATQCRHVLHPGEDGLRLSAGRLVLSPLRRR
ncbi:hypothetical protein [Streptomyces sp. NPDC006147]|uniref:hypothetical protein n=1 Tax=Streptomyces sp. NPDC006147 TaxID=3155597 RepID=UPI0033B5675F